MLIFKKLTFTLMWHFWKKKIEILARCISSLFKPDTLLIKKIVFFKLYVHKHNSNEDIFLFIIILVLIWQDVRPPYILITYITFLFYFYLFENFVKKNNIDVCNVFTKLSKAFVCTQKYTLNFVTVNCQVTIYTLQYRKCLK